ncbi:DUF3301 domain-containing protein [Colwellia sp. D2M02]|uniref:DUF3301 domain-containing protein n=1 Tax=Colwellia asteriadis TaxID=517723 RepID=A0ABP3WIL0_9GAMM|nr:DUF3301 domain-containing protein [Colwellia sp. D2M02]MBU2892170.1 DUF3301 domain-containing protein [Colwellia sp. D2M02]
MENIYYLLIAFLIAWYFIYLRKVSECAKVHVDNYCKKSGLQFIALARRTSRFSVTKEHGACIKSVFDFEFSGDGESNNQGTLTLCGLKLEQVVLPAYKINEPY